MKLFDAAAADDDDDDDDGDDEIGRTIRHVLYVTLRFLYYCH